MTCRWSWAFAGASLSWTTASRLPKARPQEIRANPKVIEAYLGRRIIEHSPMLEIKNLCVNYGAIAALHGISLSVPDGEIVTLIGANGAGKTTTLKTISGLVKPGGGEILYEGRNIAGLPPHQIVARGISQSPEGRMIFANFTVLENLHLGAYLQRDKASRPARTRARFGLFPRLAEREKQIAGTLQRRRAANAGHWPRADEPAQIAHARRTLARPRARSSSKRFLKRLSKSTASRA